MAKNHLHLSPRLAWRLSPLLVVVLFFISVGTISGFTLFPIPGFLLNSSADPLPANGVDLDSGPSGTTFTFRVAYFDFSTSNVAPTTAELHIDLDGNGIVGGLVTPFYKPPQNSTFWSWAWVSGLLALWLMAMLLARHKKALRPVYAHLALVMSLALFLLVLGCGGGGTDEGDFSP